MSEGNQKPMFNRFLKNCRVESGLTIAALAEESGVSAPYISNLESDQFHNPTYDVVEKLSNAMGADSLAREILHRTARNGSSLFALGYDVDIKRSLQVQSDDRLKEVYIAAENILEMKDEEFLNNVINNIQVGVRYTYFMKEQEKFQPLRHNLEKRLGEKETQTAVKCITASNYFLFHPGFVILRSEDPPELFGLYAKWFNGSPCRVYEMEQSDCHSHYSALDTVCQNLDHTLTYVSDSLGKVTRNYP